MRLSTWRLGILAAAGIALVGLGRPAVTAAPDLHALARVNARLDGRVLDFTNNHGHDRRIWSAALQQKRDLYVYLPPGFDPARRYPFAMFLHGATQDEQFFLQLVELVDRTIAEGRLPPFLVAAPDGSIQGQPTLLNSASFYANTRAGRFEDWIMHDAWNFVMQTFPIRPEREARALMGASMGGCGAFALAIKHKQCVKTAIGFAPALNLRWVDCHGNYFTPFDPNCWGWREKVRPMEVIGRPDSCLKIRFSALFSPIIGNGPDAISELARINPIEIMDAYDLRPGELNLFVAYGGQDEFNIGAQVESFLYRAKQRGIEVGVSYDPQGRHDVESGKRQMPEALRWVAPLVAPKKSP